jgi:tetratricopeptide (TPR) repeat protein
LDDSDASGWYNLGAIHKRKENMSSAVDCFSRAIALKPDYSRACYALATGCLDIGDVEAAVNAWRNLLTIEPNHDSKEDFGTLLVELGEGEAKVLELAGGLPPTMPEGPALAEEAIAYINEGTPLMARALSVAGKHTESVLCWKELLKVDKENADYWLGLANALAAAGDDATAARCRQKYEGLSGTSPSVEVANETMAAQPQTMVEDLPRPEPAPVENVAPIVDLPMPEPSPQPTPAPTPEPSPEVDLAKAALDATKKAASIPIIESVASNAIANQDVEWYNKGLALLSEKKYQQGLSCFDKALPLFTHDDNMVIRILNARGNCFYYLEEYPKCIENHHKAMLIEPTSVTGATLYNMGTAYGEMERFPDAMKCFEQAIPRGLTKEQQKLAKEQIRRCKLLLKEQEKKVN